MRHLCLYICGEISLHASRRLATVLSAELIHKPRQFQQIRHAEERTMLAYDDLRVRSNEVRPLRRNGADRRIIDLQQKTSSIGCTARPRKTSCLPLSG